jgi:cardiolipin synthase
MNDRILTIPNALTMLRALGIPVFLWFYLHDHRPVLSFFILGLGAATDYLDGKVARALHQESKLGAALDPAIDRAYIAATLIALASQRVIPWWMVVLLFGRDLVLAILLVLMRRQSAGIFEVTYLGKAATFNLLYAFPLLLLGGDTGFHLVFRIMGWSFAIWGVGLYLLTGIQYGWTGIKILATHRNN